MSRNNGTGQAQHLVGRLSTRDLLERREQCLRALQGPLGPDEVDEWKQNVVNASLGLLHRGLIQDLFEAPYSRLTDDVLRDEGALGVLGRKKLRLALIKAWRLSLYRLVLRDSADDVEKKEGGMPWGNAE